MSMDSTKNNTLVSINSCWANVLIVYSQNSILRLASPSHISCVERIVCGCSLLTFSNFSLHRSIFVAESLWSNKSTPLKLKSDCLRHGFLLIFPIFFFSISLTYIFWQMETWQYTSFVFSFRSQQTSIVSSPLHVTRFQTLVWLEFLHITTSIVYNSNNIDFLLFYLLQ